MNSSLRLGIAQMTSIDDVAANLNMVHELYHSAARDKPDLIVFPENTLAFRIRSGVAVHAVDLHGPEIRELRERVDKIGTGLMLTTAVQSAGQKPVNSTLCFRPGEEPEVVYRKIHLFDVDVVGVPPVRESDHYQAGSETKVIELAGWKIGLSICYDLRFSELYSAYAQKADLILVPSAFLVPTGQAHWHVLLRARAIETQAFVAAPAQSGTHVSGDHKRSTFGHSLVVDPWGGIVTEIDGGPQVRVVELAREKIEQVRRQIPMGNHRRLC